MTDPTLATRPLIPFLQDWLSSHANAINSFANSVGIAPTLVVAGPIQEASTIITSKRSPDEQSDIRGSVDLYTPHVAALVRATVASAYRGAHEGYYLFLNFRNSLDREVETGLLRLGPVPQRGVSRSSRT
jgi:hypothetical protein